jgi:hypothetical protein
MTHSILSRIPFLRAIVDERFLEHRRRSTSVAGFTAFFAAIAFVGYRYFYSHAWNWDLLAVVLLFVVVKMAIFAWYRFND